MIAKFVLASFLALNAQHALAIVCPPMPERLAQTSRDVKVDIEFAAGTLGRLRAAELAIRADPVTKDLLAKHSSTEKLWILQTMASTYCSIVVSDRNSSSAEKADRWNTFVDRTFVSFGLAPAASPAKEPAPKVPTVTQSNKVAPSKQVGSPPSSQSSNASGGSTAINASGSAQVRIGIKE